MFSSELNLTLRGAAALFTLGVVFAWFGAATPMWGSFLWLGIALLVAGIVVAGVLTRELVDHVQSSEWAAIPSTQAFRPAPALRCAYCGVKLDPEAVKCESCGAPL